MNLRFKAVIGIALSVCGCVPLQGPYYTDTHSNTGISATSSVYSSSTNTQIINIYQNSANELRTKIALAEQQMKEMAYRKDFKASQRQFDLINQYREELRLVELKLRYEQERSQRTINQQKDINKDYECWEKENKKERSLLEEQRLKTEEAQRQLAITKQKLDEDYRRRETDDKKRLEEQRQLDEKLRRQQEEYRRIEADNKKRFEEQRQLDEKLSRKEENYRRRKAEDKKRLEEKRQLNEKLRQQQEEARRLEADNKKRLEEQRQQDEKLRLQQEDDKKRKDQQLQLDEKLRRQQEEVRRLEAENQKRLEKQRELDEKLRRQREDNDLEVARRNSLKTHADEEAKRKKEEAQENKAPIDLPKAPGGPTAFTGSATGR